MTRQKEIWLSPNTIYRICAILLDDDMTPDIIIDKKLSNGKCKRMFFKFSLEDKLPKYVFSQCIEMRNRISRI